MRQKLLIIFLGLEWSGTEYTFDFLVIEGLLFEYLSGQTLNFISVEFDGAFGELGALLDDSHDFPIDFGAGLLAVDVFPIRIGGCVVDERLTHTEFQHHSSRQIPHFLQIIRRSTWTLHKTKLTSLKKSYSDILPPRITQIWSISCFLFCKLDSLGRYCANPSEPLERGIMVIFSKGAAPSENHATTACPDSWNAIFFF